MRDLTFLDEMSDEAVLVTGNAIVIIAKNLRDCFTKAEIKAFQIACRNRDAKNVRRFLNELQDFAVKRTKYPGENNLTEATNDD